MSVQKKNTGKAVSQKNSSQKTASKKQHIKRVTSKENSSKKRRKSKKRLQKNKKRAIILIGILVVIAAMILLFSSKGYQYKWENCGKEAVTEDFLKKVVDISDELNIDPDDLMTVMAFESKLDPKKVNSLSGATGLIQWMPETALELGTTTDKLKNMTAIDQLDYVYKYLERYKGKLHSISDLYMSILWPAAVGEKEDYILEERELVLFKRISLSFKDNPLFMYMLL